MPAGPASATRSAVPAALLTSLDLIARAAVVVACAVFVGLGLLPRTGWYKPVTVLSGSMKPSFSPGDMVLVTPEPVRDVRVGQVISYRIPVADHHVQSHRVTKVAHVDGAVVVQTKGDANDAPDPWKAELHGTTAWRVRAVLPKIGWALFWFRSPLVHLLTVLLAPFLLALIGVLQIWRRPQPEPVGGSG